MVQDFDELLEKVGSYGRYQKHRLFFIIVPVSFFFAFNSNALIFQLVVPDHWCHVSGRENTLLSHDHWRNLTLPRIEETDGFSKCFKYNLTWLHSQESDLLFDVSKETQACDNGWEYDQRQFWATTATSYDWVCDREYYSHHALSVTMAGNAVGTLILPVIADKFLGRRNMFYVALVIHLVFTFPLFWVSNFGLNLFLRFCQGLAFETNYLMPYSIVLELMPPSKRALALMFSFISWTFGMCFTAMVAWLLPHWQYLLAFTCIPSLVGFLYWSYLPESPRYLLAKNRLDKCAAVLQQMMESNGHKLVSRDHLMMDLKKLKETEPEELPLTSVLKYPTLRLRAALLCIISMASFVVYGVVFLGVNVLPDNNFLSHFVLSISELPSNILGWAITHYLGRRCMSVFTYTGVIVFIIAATFSIQNKWLLLGVSAVVKLLATQGLYIVFVFAPELFPTPVRTSGLGTTVVFGMIGMVISPYILYNEVGPAFQYWVMLGLAVVALLASLPLPETLGLPLPQTFQEAEDLGKGRPFTTWVHHWNKHKYPAHKTYVSSYSKDQTESAGLLNKTT